MLITLLYAYWMAKYVGKRLL